MLNTRHNLAAMVIASALLLPLMPLAHAQPTGRETLRAGMSLKHQAKHKAIYNTVKDRSPATARPATTTPKTLPLPQNDPFFHDSNGG